MALSCKRAARTIGLSVIPAVVVGLTSCSGGGAEAPATQSLFGVPQSAPQASIMLDGLSGTHRADIIAAPARRGWMSPAVKKARLVYASQFQSSGLVNVYDQKGKNQAPIGQISDGLAFPAGLYVDRTGNLYVANSNAFNVPIYKRGATEPFKVLSDPGEYPNGVTTDRKGTVFVASTVTTSHLPGNVAVYAGGSTTPTSTLTDPKWQSAITVTVDSGNNLYVCFSASAGGYGVDEFLAGTTTPIDLGLNLEHACSGIVKDRQQNLVVADPGALTIDVFPPGSSSPSTTFPTGSVAPGSLSFATPAKLYASSANDGNTEIDEYTYPGGKLLNTIDQGFQSDDCVCGVAADPLEPK